MNRLNADQIEAALKQHGQITRITILSAKGSVPREAGTCMYVSPDQQWGTIGGGALEWQASQTARNVEQRLTQSIPLGPDLGQCCGGHVELLFEPITQISLDEFTPTKTPLWLYGAGHVGRAIVETFKDLPFDITWIDTKDNRFPESPPNQVTVISASDPAKLSAYAPDPAFHVVLTYSHALDLAICANVLKRQHGWLGLIGSETKATRFRKRLAAIDCDTSKLTCPIGDPSLGKEPKSIAIGLASDLIKRHKHALARHTTTGNLSEHRPITAS